MVHTLSKWTSSTGPQMVGGGRRARILAVLVAAGTVAAGVVKVLKCWWKDSRIFIKGF